MVQVTIESVNGRPLAVAKGLPARLDFSPRTLGEVTVGEVKKELETKFPRVRPFVHHFIQSSKTHFQFIVTGTATLESQ
jgi:hypothetical protein